MSPLEPLARSASVAKFSVTITFIPIATSILCFSHWVPVCLLESSAFMLATMYFCSMFSRLRAFPTESSASKTYNGLPVSVQCFCKAAQLHAACTAFCGVTRTSSFQGSLVKSGTSQPGLVITSFLISSISSWVHSPCCAFCSISIHLESLMHHCCVRLITVWNCVYMALPMITVFLDGGFEYKAAFEFPTGGNW